MEKKYGDGALSGSAGIKKHFQDIYNFLCDNKKVSDIYQEVETIFNQKVDLGLISGVTKTIEISKKSKPEFILLIANHKPVKSVLQRELRAVINETSYYNELISMIDIKIAKASYLGYGLYSEMMVDIEDFINEN